MSIDEGYIKYEAHFTEGPPPDAARVAELERWRRPLHEAGLIGHYDDLGVGYGNMSVRGGASGTFVISGTQTGHIAETNAAHYALVERVDIDANRVWSSGPIQASSESLTHAALYALSESIAAVVHVHSRTLWQSFKGRLPTTGSEVAYGTPQMAHEFERLWRRGHFREAGLAVMAGHEEGIVSIGKSLEEAAKRVLALAAGSNQDLSQNSW